MIVQTARHENRTLSKVLKVLLILSIVPPSYDFTILNNSIPGNKIPKVLRLLIKSELPA